MNVNDQLSQHTTTGVIPTTVGQLSPEDMMKYIDETRAQPAYRAQMDKAADYYDGNQLTAEILQDLDQMGFTSLMTNLIKPAIDTVLGIEAKTRVDYRMTADDDAHQPVAEALSARLKEAERETRAARACSDAYASQIKAGLGWVHVTREADPFRYPYKVESVHRREMFWDWADQSPDLRNARYVIRQKWYPIDQVIAALPQHRSLLQASGSGWQPDWMQRAREDAILMNALDQESRITVSAWDWRNIDSRRVALQEVWYATYIRGLVLELGDRTVELDRNNRLHMAAVGTGIVKPQPAVYRKLRCSIWFGPHLLQDADPGGNRLPYVPFWGFREDLTGVPYGLVRAMIPLQDEVNARRRKLMWLLSSKRVQIDSDALDARFTSFEDLVDEISRPDSVLVTNPARMNKQTAIKVESDLGLAQQQFEILTEAKEGIQAAAGIFNSVMGKTDGAKSGIAVNSLVEQSSNTLAEINDNYKFGRMLVGEGLVAMIRADLKGKQVTVVAGAAEAKKKTISLNKPAVDEITGVEYLENDTDKANVKVALEDVPATPAYRAQQQLMLSQVVASLPPQLQAPMVPFIVEATDLPERHQMASLLRKALGQPDPNGGEQQDPQVAALQQQLQALHQQSEQAMQQYEQAVQEQSQKAQELGQQVQQLQMQVRDKQGELQLKQQELQLKAQEHAQAAQERMQALQAKQSEQQVQVGQIELKKQELALNQQKHQTDAQMRAAELEHQQLVAASTHHQGMAQIANDAAAQAQQAPADVPSSDAVLANERIIAKIKADAMVEARVQAAKIAAEAVVKRAELQATATPSTLTPAQEAAADDDDGDEDNEGDDDLGGADDASSAPAATPSAAPAPAPQPSMPRPKKPVKKQVAFTYDENGRLAGASINGKPAATVKRDASGRMVGAEITHPSDA